MVAQAVDTPGFLARVFWKDHSSPTAVNNPCAMPKQVAILTSFKSYDPSYSLILVAEDQLKMLVEAGHKPVVVVEDGFNPGESFFANSQVVLKHVPSVTASNDGILPENWQEEVDMLAGHYQAIFEQEDVDVVITHDFISQAAALVHNLAARKAGSATKVRFLHWVHSVFSSNMPSNVLEASKVGRSRWPKSKIVFPNEYDRPRVARAFGVEETDVLHCPHPTDILGLLDAHPVIRRLCQEKGVLDKRVVMVYPARLDRGKQPHLNIELAAALKRIGISVAFICVDFSSTGGDKVVYREEMKAQALELGLDDTDVIFLSEFDKEFEFHAPRSVIRDLFSLSNVFMLPSRSETYSLVAQEAALLGNLMILNFDFPPMRSIFGETPKFYKFSSNLDILTGGDGSTETDYGSRTAYFDDIARWVGFMLQNDRSIRMKTWARTERSLSAVYEKFLAPLLYAE